ncbi:MAG: signal peptidase II [Chloroflexi bacterium]|nr:signal peptidase II [Chloroflexota bacterium]
MWGFLTRHSFLILVALAAFALDQITKAVVVANVARGTSWPTDGFARITHIGNTGSAFGLFDGRNSFLIIASFLGLGVLIYFYRSHPNPGLLIKGSMGLMLAGALGNLTDRLFRDHVVDFIDIGPWWIFNFADASIVTGLIILGATIVLFDQSPKPNDEPVSAGVLSDAAPNGDASQDQDDDDR